MSYDWPLSREQKRECLLSFFQREFQAQQNETDAGSDDEADGTVDAAMNSSNVDIATRDPLPWPSKLVPCSTSRSENSAMPHIPLCLLPKAKATGGSAQTARPLSGTRSNPAERGNISQLQLQPRPLTVQSNRVDQPAEPLPHSGGHCSIPKLQLQPELHPVPGSPQEQRFEKPMLLPAQTPRDFSDQKTLALTTPRGADSSMQSMMTPRTPLERKLRFLATPCKRGCSLDLTAASPSALSSVHLAEAMDDLAQELPTTMMRAQLDLTFMDRPQDSLVAPLTARETLTAAVGNAVRYGAGGGATGLFAGAAIGAACGIVPAIFTFGLSIPIGAAIGSGVGLGTGTAAGGTLGLYFQWSRGNQRQAENR